MCVLRHSLLLILMFLAACAPTGGVSRHGGVVDEGAEETNSLWSSCTPKQALLWEQKSKQDSSAPLKAARCYAVLARHGKTKSERLENVLKGRRMAQTAISRDPKSAAAHYLAAYLAGLEAENNSLKGLALVPVIESNAIEASRLNPALDHGGPDRMLGELYLRAPEPPVSIGDLDKAILHYQSAVLHAPDFVENRLGLAEAYLEDDNTGAACEQLQQVLTRMPPCGEWEDKLKKTTNLMKRLCGMEIQNN